jgi:hypothetical protein
MFEGDVQMQVNLDMSNRIAAYGDEIVYGEAEFDTKVTGNLAGASGTHKGLYHDQLEEQGEFLEITYRGEPSATGNQELRVLDIECWLRTSESMENLFPPVE